SRLPDPSEPTVPTILAAVSAVVAPQYNRRSNDRNNGNDRSSRDDRGSYSQSYRDNQRVTMSGKITSMQRERDGYRVQLDRGRDSYWIPSSRLGRRTNDLRVGIDISLGGIFRGGMINVDAVNWPGNYGYGSGIDNGYLRGVVDRVDYRSGFATIREEGTRRYVDVRLRDDAGQLRRGDLVTLEGRWNRGNVFDAYRIDDVR
ncbi:MAG TPA: hypothetical protein VLU46_02730, partial [Thermoanaerobaculia bacterium]|nr:hypothetical protein [Thermoanaerobaculia bacterium]